MRITDIIIDNRGMVEYGEAFHRVRVSLTGSGATTVCTSKPIHTFVRQKVVDDHYDYAICGRCARIMVAEKQMTIVESRKEMTT